MKAKRITRQPPSREQVLKHLRHTIWITEHELHEMRLRLRSIDEHAAQITDEDDLPLRMRRIIAAVCRRCNVTLTQIRESFRDDDVTRARELVTVLAHQRLRMSFPAIAKALGRTAHSTFVIAYYRVVNRMDDQDDRDLRELATELDKPLLTQENDDGAQHKNLDGGVAAKRHKARTQVQDTQTRGTHG